MLRQNIAGHRGVHLNPWVVQREGSGSKVFESRSGNTQKNNFSAETLLQLRLAHAPQHALSRDDLNRRADLALRTAKRNQRGSLVVFKPSMDADFNDRRFIERELKRAISEKALDVHYQPIVSSDGNRIVGAEALLRWTHPVRGQVPPGVFVPVAEQAGLMGKLGEFVLRRALTDAKRWADLYIAVNLSPVQVRDPALLDLVTAVLNRNGFDAELLNGDLAQKERERVTQSTEEWIQAHRFAMSQPVGKYRWPFGVMVPDDPPPDMPPLATQVIGCAMTKQPSCSMVFSTLRYFASESCSSRTLVPISTHLNLCSRTARSSSAIAASGSCIGSVAMPRRRSGFAAAICAMPSLTRRAVLIASSSFRL